jgi:hypothetical protein
LLARFVLHLPPPCCFLLLRREHRWTARMLPAHVRTAPAFGGAQFGEHVGIEKEHRSSSGLAKSGGLRCSALARDGTFAMER